MAIIGLNLPTEIPWERICVSRDMMARDGHHLPGKWRSSLAVFKYVPDDDYQAYPGREISYLKLVATVCGFQHRDKEIEGRIDWLRLSETNILNVHELLDQYYPCTGALLQLTVFPAQGAETTQWDDYPYLMDFQPKKRELFEMATDTNERMSRSLESLNVRKASGTTESLEVLDIDQGGGASGKLLFGLIEAGANSSGQHGTKRLSSEEESIARGTDQSREKRESQSHTTQISQMYHLFDAYHQGTNRGVFFIQPRKATLEEPSGFVRGPRPVEGIQEIFVIVNRPKAGPEYCVSVRLDTAHYVKVPVMGYGFKDEEVELSANATPPGFRDPSGRPAPNETMKNKIGPWNTGYECCFLDDKKALVWVPPVNYVLDTSNNGGFTVIDEQVTTMGKNEHFVDGPTVVLRSEATAHSCYISPNQRADHIDSNLPNPAFVYGASAKQHVRIHMQTELPTEVTGTQEVLMITTRGLDCCGGSDTLKPYSEVGRIIQEGIVEVTPMKERSTTLMAGGDRKAEPSNSLPGPSQTPQGQTGREGLMTAREANELNDAIRGHLQRSAAKRERGEKVVSLLDTDLFADLLQSSVLSSPNGAHQLAKPARECLPEHVRERLREHYGTRTDTVTRQDVAAFDARTLAELTGLELGAARRLRLELLGVSLVEPKASYDSATSRRPEGSA